MENLVGPTTVAIRGASGKLGSEVSKSFEMNLISSTYLRRETNYNSLLEPMIILDFAGPNPKNDEYWETFNLNEFLEESQSFLEWVTKSKSIYVRIGSFGEFNPAPTKYEYVAQEISRQVNTFVAELGLNGLILFPSNIYGRASLGNIVETLIKSSFRQEELRLRSPNKTVNFIYYEDFIFFLLNLVGRFKTGNFVNSNLALTSEYSYLVSDLKDYTFSQKRKFDISRSLPRTSLPDLSSGHYCLDSVGVKTLPDRLKNYIDLRIKNGIEFDIHAL